MQLITVAPLGEKLPRVLDRLKTMGEDGGPLAQVIAANTATDANALGLKIEGALMLFQASKEPELVGVLNIIKGLKRRMDSGQLKIVLMLGMKSPPEFLLKRLRSVGISEIITEPVTDRGLVLKLERYIKALPRFKEIQRQGGVGPGKGRAANAAGGKGGAGARGGSAGAGGGETSSEIKKAQPLSTSSDFWLTQGGGARRVGARWVLRLLGPGPAVGKWVEVETSNTGTSKWRWDPLDPKNDPFHKDPGQWFFRGQRAPQFQEFLWWFTGNEVSLEFVKPDGAVLIKFKTDGPTGPLTVASDSPSALRLIPLIEQTFSKKIKSKKGVAATTEEEKLLAAKKKAEGKSGEDFEGEDSYGVDAEEARRPFRLVAPLELKSDFWTFEEDGLVRKVGMRWSIRIIGPGRSAGRWIQIDSTDPEVKFWQWTPQDPEKDVFVKEKGAWVFRGDEPIFERLRWILVGENPDLTFYLDEKPLGTKIKLAADKKLEISRDSQAARAARQAIEETLEFKATIKAQEEKELKAQLEAENKEGKELEAEIEAQESTELNFSDKKKKRRNGKLSLEGEEAEDDSEGQEDSDQELDLKPKKKKRRKTSEDGSDSEEDELSSDANEDSEDTDEESADDDTSAAEAKEREREDSEEEESADSKTESRSEKDDPEEDAQEDARPKTVDPAAKKKSGEANSAEQKEAQPKEAAAEKAQKKKADAEAAAASVAKKKDKTSEEAQSKGSNQAAEETQAKAEKAKAELSEENASEPEEFHGLFEEEKAKEAKKHGIHAKHGEDSDEEEAKVAPVPGKGEAQPTAEEKADAVAAALKEDQGTPPGTVEALEAIKKDLPKVEERAEPKPAEKAPGPHVTVLAIAFYAAEIMSGEERDPQTIAENFCAYVSKSSGGVNISLWLQSQGALEKIAAVGKGEADLAEPLQASAVISQKGLVTIPETCSAAVVSSRDGKILGVVACSGPGFETLPAEYVIALAKILTGISTSLAAARLANARKAA